MNFIERRRRSRHARLIAEEIRPLLNDAIRAASAPRASAAPPGDTNSERVLLGSTKLLIVVGTTALLWMAAQAIALHVAQRYPPDQHQQFYVGLAVAGVASLLKLLKEIFDAFLKYWESPGYGSHLTRFVLNTALALLAFSFAFHAVKGLGGSLLKEFHVSVFSSIPAVREEDRTTVKYVVLRGLDPGLTPLAWPRAGALVEFQVTFDSEGSTALGENANSIDSLGSALSGCLVDSDSTVEVEVIGFASSAPLNGDRFPECTGRGIDQNQCLAAERARVVRDALEKAVSEGISTKTDFGSFDIWIGNEIAAAARYKELEDTAGGGYTEAKGFLNRRAEIRILKAGTCEKEARPYAGQSASARLAAPVQTSN